MTAKFGVIIFFLKVCPIYNWAKGKNATLILMRKVTGFAIKQSRVIHLFELTGLYSICQ